MQGRVDWHTEGMTGCQQVRRPTAAAACVMLSACRGLHAAQCIRSLGAPDAAVLPPKSGDRGVNAAFWLVARMTRYWLLSVVRPAICRQQLGRSKVQSFGEVALGTVCCCAAPAAPHRPAACGHQI